MHAKVVHLHRKPWAEEAEDDAPHDCEKQAIAQWLNIYRMTQEMLLAAYQNAAGPITQEVPSSRKVASLFDKYKDLQAADVSYTL